jgi:2-amino-4-hydroxy-6-hydroxymethyldihydropteridine diphosphokinase
MVEVCLGLGSNLGDREGNLQEALWRLGSGVRVTAVSSFYETEPLGYTEQPRFVNAVCRGQTDLEPLALLALLKAIEREMGRQPSLPNGPRLIDIDLLFYGEEMLESPELTIPHPRLTQRAFVLVPLAEIAPHWQHPDTGKTIAELAASVGRAGVRALERTEGRDV